MSVDIYPMVVEKVTNARNGRRGALVQMENNGVTVCSELRPMRRTGPAVKSKSASSDGRVRIPIPTDGHNFVSGNSKIEIKLVLQWLRLLRNIHTSWVSN